MLGRQRINAELNPFSFKASKPTHLRDKVSSFLLSGHNKHHQSMKAMLERELDTILTIQDEKQNKNIIISVDCVVPEHFMATYLISPISITTVSTNTFMVGYICSCVSYFGHYIWTQRRIGLGGQLRGFSNPPPTRPIRPIPDSR